MKHFFCSVVFLSFQLLLNAQQNTVTMQSGTSLLASRPDVMGKVLVSDAVTGANKVISADELKQDDHPPVMPDLKMLKPADLLMFPGFPVSIPNVGYNDGQEGMIFCNMDADPELEIVINLGQTTQALNLDGTSVPGWPTTVTQIPSGGPAFGDIDGDGQGEIVVGTNSGSTNGLIYAWKKNGSAVTGFPVNSGYIFRSPILADLNQDGKMEIIAGRRMYPQGQVLVITGNGSPLAGWPQSITAVPGASATAGDITGDGIPEVICQDYYSLWAWSASGVLLAGFPYAYPTLFTSSYSSCVLADLDSDGKREIIFGTHEVGGSGRGMVIILRNNGTAYPGWPVITNCWIYAPPSVGYINNDNILDIAVGDQILSGTPMNFLYAWNSSGTALPGFPHGPNDAINAHTLIADIDNDSRMELIFDDNTTVQGRGKYHAANDDGTVVSGWPITTEGGTFFVTPAVTDINLNGIMDFIGAGSAGSAPSVTSYVSLWNMQVPYNAAAVRLPMFQYNQMRNGIYDQPSIVPVEMESFSAETEGTDVCLAWVTATEKNNAGFRLYRNSELLAYIEGKGTSTEKNSYSYRDKNLLAGKYIYRLEQVDYDGTVHFAGSLEAEVGRVPSSYRLVQNYPNPFNPVTRIRYELADAGDVLLTVSDALGREAAVLVNENKPAGSYEAVFDASALSSGIYFYFLKVNGFTSVRKMVFLK